MITLMTISEIESVMNLWSKSMKEQFSSDVYFKQLPSEIEIKEIYETSNIYVVKDEDSTIVGYASIVEGGYLENIYIEENYRRKSLATQLIDSIKLKYDEIVTDIFEDNTEAIHFFNKMNFVNEGTSLNDTLNKNEIAFYWSN